MLFRIQKKIKRSILQELNIPISKIKSQFTQDYNEERPEFFLIEILEKVKKLKKLIGFCQI